MDFSILTPSVSDRSSLSTQLRNLDPGVSCLVVAAFAGTVATVAGATALAVGFFTSALILGLALGLSGVPLLWGGAVLLSMDVARLLMGGSPLADGLGTASFWLLGIGLVLACRSRSARTAPVHESLLGELRPNPRVWIIFVAVDLIVNLRILFGEGIPINGDASSSWLFGNVRNVALYLFNDAGSVSNLENVDRALYALPVTAIVNLFHLGSGTYSKVQWLVFPLVSMIGCYLLILHAIGESGIKVVRTAPIVAACLIYAFSPWVLEQVQANFYWLAYSLTPFVVLISARLAARPSISRCLWLSLLITLCGTTPQYLLFTIAISGCVLVTTWLRVTDRRLTSLTRAGRWLAAIGGMLLVLNASWLLPTYRVLKAGGGVSPGYSLQASDVDLFSRHSSPINILRGYDQWIFPYAQDGLLRHLLDPWVAGLTALVPLTAVFLLLNRRVLVSPTLRMLALPTIVATTLALGTRLPFYRWLLLDAPLISDFGWLLRVPGKLSYVVWLFLAVVIGVAGNIYLPTVKPMLRALSCGALSVGILAGIAIKAGSTFYNYYVPVRQPAEYAQLASFLSAQSGQGRVIYLAPYAGSFGKNRLQFETSFTWNPTRVATNTPAVSSPLPSIDYYHLTYRDWQPLVGKTLGELSSPHLGSGLLSNAGVQFVVYHADIVGGEAQAKLDVAALERSDLRLCQTFGEEIFLFCNRSAAPLVRGSGVNYSKVNPTQYQVTWSGKQATSPITFSQPFDPLWELRLGRHVVHPRSDGDGYTSFDIVDTSGKGSLVYAPQHYYVVGVFISGMGLAALILGCFLTGLRGRRRYGADMDPSLLPSVIARQRALAA